MTSPVAGSPRPRILHFVTHLALGGAERIALDLACGLRAEAESAIFAVKGEADDAFGQAMRQEMVEHSIPFFSGTKLPFKCGGFWLAARRAANAVQVFRPDIIHLHTEIPEFCYALMVTMRPGLRTIPVVRTIHNSVFWNHWRPVGAWSERRLGPSVVAGVSLGALESFTHHRRAAGMPMPNFPPKLIFNGLNPAGPPRPADRPASNLVRLLVAGRLEWQKGTDLLPRILSLVRPRAGLECELTVLGSGAHTSLLKKLSAAPPPGWTIRLGVPVVGLVHQMTSFDLVLMPSRFEGLSLVAIEAQLLAIPLVATDAPGLREQLPEGHPWRAAGGNADDFARVLQQALDEPSSWPAATERSRAFALRHFGAVTMCGAYRDLYASAHGGPRS